ncbi:autotransporter outer membrane beta-barrel domain-containing protein [uncultured Fusobacterium sp.]|uniref:autotransporter outer membrane beta-barrel domain-containing protein n=1 Tax=uncultured Fusobacterium sp. TaxID=159267 RepID=UPI0025F239B1|nr:autotransporter outer membrane beta-barrel domain-containing protein [uncultured Fusobacterium sp.]
MKKNNKKRVKEKLKVTLRILVLFVIVRNVGLGYDPNSNNVDSNVDSDVEVIEKKDEEIQLNDIDHEGYGKVKGLYIKNSGNLIVNIEKINVTLKKNDGVPGIVSANGLENVSTKSGNDKVTISDGLKINVTAKEDLGIKATQLVGVTNTRELTLGKNTKINVVMEGEVASISTAYGMELKSNSVTHLGEGSEINVSNSTGIATGISIDSTGFLGDESNVFIGDNVKIRAEVRDAKSEIKNGHWALGIYQMLGDTVTIGNGLILETEINLSNGVLGQSYAVYNMANGKINIGKNAIISTKGTNASQVCGIYNEGSSSKATIGDGGTITAIGENTVFVMGLSNNKGGEMNIGNGVKISSILNSKSQKNTAYSVYNKGKSTLNIGKNSEISVEGRDANQIRAVHNEGSSSKATIGDGGTITAIGENTVFVMGLSNNKGGEMNIGNGVKISSILNSKSQKNTVYSVYNTGNSILNIGKNSEISAVGRDAKTVYGIHNDGASSEVTIGDGGTITVIGENSNFVRGVNNTNGGEMNIGNGIKISTILNSKNQENYAHSVYNTGNSILNIGKNSEINVEGRDANQIRAVYNDGSSSEVIIEDGSIITASGENNVVVIGVSNKTGSIKLNGGTSIYSDGYAVYNDDGNVSIKDKGYSKKIQGTIFSTKAGAVTDILLDTDDSYLEGKSVQENGGIFNFGLKNNAVWYVPQNSEVTNFDMEKGIVDMTQNRSGETIKGKQVISIDKTSGSGGTYIMDISPEDRDQTGDKTDGINIEKADTVQKNYIQVGKTSIVGLVKHNFSDKESSSIKIASADKNATFEGTKFTDTASIYDYVLSLEENIKGEAGEKNTWYVTGVEKQEGEVIKNIETAITLNYMSAVSSRSELNSVHKRLGEIHNGTSENGAWAGTSSGQMEHNKSSEKFKNEYNALQIGYDKRKETEKRSIFTGFAVHKKEGKTDFKNGDGKNYDIGISLYKSFVMEDNSYANLVVKYSYINNEHKNYTSDMQEMKTDYDTWSGSISFEYGKKYTKNSWYMIPQMQMDYTFVKGADYAMNSGIKVEQKNINSLVGRAGMYAGYDFERSSHFIKTGILQEFSGDYGARITGIDTTVNKKYKGKDTWLEAGIGGYFEVGKTGTTNIYYNIEKTFGSKFERNWQVSLGLRIKF